LLFQIIKAVSDFAENLRNAMFFKRLKAIDVSNATKIPPPTISRYLSGTHQPTTDNLITISKYLGISPEALLSSSDAPESIQKSRVGSSVTEPLLKTIEAQDKVIAVQEELLKQLEKEIKNLEEAKTESKERHTKRRGQTKNPTKPKKRKVGFLRKRKKT